MFGLNSAFPTTSKKASPDTSRTLPTHLTSIHLTLTMHFFHTTRTLPTYFPNTFNKHFVYVTLHHMLNYMLFVFIAPLCGRDNILDELETSE